jgi:pimeloyl-ACP methyl ester carboxylesterase
VVTPTAFREGEIETGGARVRYLEAGQGMPLVHLQADGAPRLTRAHELLGRRFRVVIIAVPDGPSSVDTLLQALTALGLDAVSLVAASSSAATALRLAVQAPARVRALVLEAPAALRPADRDADLARRLPGLATPTLVLLGTRDDAVRPAPWRVYTELIPGSHLVFVYEAGQAIGADRPEAFAEVVADFVERGDAFVISRAQTVIHP